MTGAPELPASFPPAGRLVRGYDRGQVDALVSRARAGLQRGGLRSGEVRTTAFDLVRGGYDVETVDEALERLEDALAQRERARAVERAGHQGWRRVLDQRSRLLATRLRRGDGHRFPHPGGWRRGYSTQDVDRFCVAVLRHLEGGHPLPVQDVRRAVFGSASGSRAYQEAAVDAFLDRVVEVMVAAG